MLYTGRSMAQNKKQPTKLAFVLSEGGLRGFWRGLMLSEIFALLVIAFFLVIALIDGTDLSEALAFFLTYGLFGQMVGVLPSVIIGLVAGALIAWLVVSLREREPGQASRLGAAVALLMTMVLELVLGMPGPTGFEIAHLIFLFIPYAIFIFEAVRQTRKQLPKVTETFAPGDLSTRTVNIFFWAVCALRVVLFVLPYLS